MDDRLADHYLTELNHVRKLCDAFAQGNPDAAHLRVKPDGCDDPFVERLLEGFAYLSARVHLKFESQFPRFTQQILEVVCPNHLSPTPSMTMVQFVAAAEPTLRAGQATVDRGSQVVAASAVSRTPCVYTTAHAVPLWPLEVADARYTREVTPLGLRTGEGPGDGPRAEAAVVLRLRTTDDQPLNTLPLDRLAVYLNLPSQFQLRLYKQLLADATGVVVDSVGGGGGRRAAGGPASLRPVGFDAGQQLLPDDPRTFQGYRLLQEYFAFRPRFLSVEFTGLSDLLGHCGGTEADLIVSLATADRDLEPQVSADAFRLFCTPAVNLFDVPSAWVDLSRQEAEHLVKLDTRATDDYEIFSIAAVQTPRGQAFAPFYAAKDVGGVGGRYYSPNRVPSQRRRAGAAEADYRGTDVYLSLVDAAHAPYRHDLNRLEVSARCTNRDLPLYLSRSGGEVELRWEQGGVVSHVRCLSGVTPPRPSPATGPYAWRLVNYLTLNYLSIGDRGNGGTGGGTDGAAGLRDLLSLYARAGDPRAADEVNAILSVRSKPFTCRVPPTGANDWEVAFARGVEVQVELAERAFADGWAYLLGSVLNQFFARYVSVNSMVRVVVGGTWNHKRTEIRWSANTGRASSF